MWITLGINDTFVSLSILLIWFDIYTDNSDDMLTEYSVKSNELISIYDNGILWEKRFNKNVNSSCDFNSFNLSFKFVEEISE